MSDHEEFENQNRQSIKRMAVDEEMSSLTRAWFNHSFKHRYSYHFKWMGMPIIQYPQDIIAMQELIMEVKPDCIIETGVARGGSLIFYASMLKLIGGSKKVIGIDIDIRQHNRERIQEHELNSYIELVEGSSVSEATYTKVEALTKGLAKVMVVLDSNHSHEHVKKELELYSELVSSGSYLIVFDTHCQFLPEELLNDRPWGRDDNPYTAVIDFLKNNNDFERIPYEDKLQISAAPYGFLKKL